MFKQIKQFDHNKMGKQKGWCLRNCCQGFGITGGGFPSAKADMDYQRAHGTLHTSAIPTEVAVPVYIDTSSPYEHIGVMDHGVFYSDGVKSDIKKFKVVGWGEFCGGQRVVEKVADVVKSTTFLPSRGYWKLGDNDSRIAELASFMRKTFPAYTSAAALGSYYGQNLRRAIVEFQKRTNLEACGCVGVKTYAKLKEFGFKK